MRLTLQILCSVALLLPLSASAQTIRTFAGTGTAGYSGDGGAAIDARLSGPVGITGDGTGQIWVADAGNHVIRRVTAARDSIFTYAGTGTAGYSGDNAAATAAALNSPTDVFVDSAGILYVADTGNHVIRRITAAGVISTIAGTGAPGDSGDGGAATAAKLNSPTGVWATNGGVVYIADRGNHRIRRVAADGTITTFAGTGTAGFSGDGGKATTARLDAPADVFMDTAGVLYIADSGNHRIRAVATDSTITTIAGTGAAGFSGDGDAATGARLAFPRSVFVDTVGSVYIADRFNHRIRRINPNGNITTLAGDGTPGVDGDGGAANVARLSSPGGIWVHDGRELFVADGGNHRLRWIDDDAVLGLSGTTTAGRAAEVRLLTVAFTGDGATAVKGVRLTLSDLTSATGLTTADLEALHLYESPDSLLSTTADTLRGSLDAAAIELGATVTLQASPSPVPAAGQRRFYIVSAVIADTAVEGHAFKLGFPVGGLSTTVGGQGGQVRAADSDRVTIDIVATRLRFATQPDGVISGNPFNRQPVVEAVDAAGFVDGDFSDVVTLGVGDGSGTLLQNTATATAGIATFSGVTYVTSTDDEPFTLVADDEVGGAEGDLPADTSNVLRANTVNDPPTVTAFPLNLREDDTQALPLSSLVADIDDSLSTLTITAVGRHAVGTVDGDQLTVRPDANFYGMDTLRVTAEDPFGGIGADDLILSVRPVNDAPTLLSLGRRQLLEDDTLRVDLLSLVADVETPATQMRWAFVPAPGLAISYQNATGQLRAWAAPDSAGTFTLRITTLDPEGSAASTLDTIEFAAVNDAPRLQLPSGLSVARTETLSLSLADLARDPDDADAVLSWTAAQPVGLTPRIEAEHLRLTPVAGFGGTASVVLTATDPAGATGTDTLRLHVYSPDPQPPVLAALPALTVELGDTLRWALSPWVDDADHDAAVLTWTAAASRGIARVDADTLVYLPADSAAYDASLSVEVTDPDGLSDSATLTVHAVAPLPLLADLADTLTIGADGGERRLDDFLRDPAQGAAVTWTASGAGDIEVRIDTEARLLRITPVDGSRAGGTVMLVAETATKTGRDTLTVVIANATPRVDLPDLFLDAGESTQFLLDDFAVDDGGDAALTWEVEPLAAGLSASLNAALRAVTLSAAAGATGTIPVRFTATDAQGAAGGDTMGVTVRAPSGQTDSSATDTAGTNTAPVIGALSLLQVTAGDSAVIELDGVASDDGGATALRWTAEPGPGLELELGTGRRLVVRPLAGYAGLTSVRLTATDLYGARATGTLPVEVRRVVDTPAPGDFDGDGDIGLVDFFLFADHIDASVFTSGWDPAYDLTDDGRVGFDDFFVFADLYDRAHRR